MCDVALEHGLKEEIVADLFSLTEIREGQGKKYEFVINDTAAIKLNAI